MIEYLPQIEDILEAARVKISSLKPSEWAEQNIIMPKPFPGPLRYSTTPYTREIIDCLAPDHPAREIAVMGAAQFGKTASIIIPGIGYVIENDPGNIIMTVGHESLMEEAMGRVDWMLDTTGLRKLIKPTAQRAKNQKSGDTNTIKQFPNGYYKLSPASNPKIWQQADYKYGLIDDFDRVKSSSKNAGDIRSLILKRFTAYHTTRKIIYLSSPELEDTSNIYKVYKLGDQRKFLVPCPCCGTCIELKWSVESKYGNMAGMTWKIDQTGIIKESIGYICQECEDFFTDQNKSDWINKGYWNPTAKPFKPDFYSYHMPSWYSPHGMTDWEHYVYEYVEACPPGEPRNEQKYQTFLNLNEGWPYKPAMQVIKANYLQKNIRNYQVGEIPEELSIRDGNGRIVLITCACDLNGKLDDARLDYEIVGWSESGSSYSIEHGSIGTFIPNESGKKFKQDREKFTYEHNRSNSIWPILDKVIAKYIFINKDKKRILPIAIDTGFCDKEVWEYVEKSNWLIRGVKGDKEDKYIRYNIDVPNFKKSRERPEKLYILQGGLIKDDLAQLVNLKWDAGNDATQPAGFMNFPTPSDGKYLYSNYFEHYEAESRELISKDGETPMFRWIKVKANAQNHLFDCRVYNMAIRDIFVAEVGKSLNQKDFFWPDYVKLALGK